MIIIGNQMLLYTRHLYCFQLCTQHLNTTLLSVPTRRPHVLFSFGQELIWQIGIVFTNVMRDNDRPSPAPGIIICNK